MRSKRFAMLAGVALVAVLVFGTGPAVGAQSEDRVAANLNDSGIFVESGADGSDAEFLDVIERLAAVGLDLHIASLADDDPDIETFARSLRDKTGGTVLVITPGQLAGASDAFSDNEVATAIDRSIDDFDSSVAEGALSFGEGLIGRSTAGTTGSPDTTQPSSTTSPAVAVVPEATAVSPPDSGGGSSGGFLIFFLIVVAAIIAVVFWVRSKNKKRVVSEVANRRNVVSAELETLGVQIVDLSDPMSLNENATATEHFRTANEQFLDLQERLEAASSLWEVTEIDIEADTTGWHLDAAAAILGGDRVPDRPAAPSEVETTPGRRQEVPPVEDSREPSTEPVGDSRDRAGDRNRVESRIGRRSRRGKAKQPRAEAQPRRESPRQQERSQRRGGWSAPKTTGAGIGGALGGILTKVLVGGVLGGGGKAKAPRRWNGAGTINQPARQRTSSRSSGSATRSRTGSSRSSASRSRGGSASRSRGGGGSASRDR